MARSAPARRRCGAPRSPLARERGHLVLVSRANEAEASLAFAALGDLLRDVVGEGLTRLPPPQATALRVAVLLQEPEGPASDPLAVSVATLGLVRALAAERPVLIALDDYAWLDAASTNVLAFVLRRLETERIGVLGTMRANGEHAAAAPAGRGDDRSSTAPGHRRPPRARRDRSAARARGPEGDPSAPRQPDRHVVGRQSPLCPRNRPRD